MMRATGGFAFGATSTRSNCWSRACASASGRGLTPSCSPSAPTRNTSRARMRSLIRTSCVAIGSPASSTHVLPQSACCDRCWNDSGREDGGHLEASAMPEADPDARALGPTGYADPDAPEVGGQVGTTGCHAPRSHFLWLILKGYQREHTV